MEPRNPDYHMEITTGEDEQYYVALTHANGEIVMGSEGYRTKWNARRIAKKNTDRFGLSPVVDHT